MAQQRADSPETIYQILSADVDLMQLVGQVVFVDGTTLDAISITSPGASLPNVKSTTGLEVIIHDVSDLGRREYITDDIDITTTWKVFLVAWPGADGSTLNNAARRIMEMFSKATTIETAPTPQGLGAMVQLLVLIPSDSVVSP
jgi:capsule polysaccharide modification protein KpsS